MLPLECNSTELWRPLGKWLDLYVLPAVCLCGLALNLACVCVFLQRKTVVLFYTASGGTQQSQCHSPGRKLSPETFSETDGSPTRGTHHLGTVMRSRLGTAENGNATAGSMVVVKKRQACRRSHPLVPVLLVLCICDSLQLLFSLLVLYVPALHDHLQMDPLGPVAQLAYLSTGGLAGGLLAANCASIWTMSFISWQRHRAIVRPLDSISHGRSGSHVPLFLIALCALLFNAPVWFEFHWAVSQIEDSEGRLRTILWHRRSWLAQNEQYRFLMHKVLYPVCVYLIPLVLISVLNCRILHFMRASARLHSAVGHRRRMAKERRSVWLLLSIVLVFFLCHTGGLIIRFVDARQHGNEPCFVFAKDLVNFLFNINSLANPMLYFFFTKQFRDLRTTWASSHGTSRSSNGHTSGPPLLQMRRTA